MPLSSPVLFFSYFLDIIFKRTGGHSRVAKSLRPHTIKQFRLNEHSNSAIRSLET